MTETLMNCALFTTTGGNHEFGACIVAYSRVQVLGFLRKGRTIRYLRGGGEGWANTKKKFAHRKNPEKKYRAQQTY